MRIALGLVLLTVVGCGGGDADSPSKGRLTLPEVYPLVRANTPSALIADPKYQASVSVAASALLGPGHVGGLPQALGGAINLALAVQQRLYMGGPTELLRIVKDMDDRVAGLDTDASKHECLTSMPVDKTYALPAGQTFGVKLQCLQSFGAAGSPGSGWVGFGFGRAAIADAGAPDDDFYLVEGQTGGMGGAYHIDRARGDVEAWIAVADNSTPLSSQVIMHMVSRRAPGTLELAFAGSGVGFCSAHLRTANDFIFIQGKTNGAPAPEVSVPAGTQYCDATRAGCFAVGMLDVDLGAEAMSCSGIAMSTFEIHPELDASSDAPANVMFPTIYTYFNQPPAGVAAF